MPRHTKIKNIHNETLKAGCVVVNDKGEILLVTDRRKKIWTFPKGHAEVGETAEQVAVRETREETGYTVELVRRLPDVSYTHAQTGEPVRVAMFLAKPVGEPGKAEKGTVAQWFSPKDARDAIYYNLAFLLKEIRA